MEYHEGRLAAELRQQGEHERAEEFRLKAMRHTRRRIPEHLVPVAGTPRTPHPCRSEKAVDAPLTSLASVEAGFGLLVLALAVTPIGTRARASD